MNTTHYFTGRWRYGLTFIIILFLLALHRQTNGTKTIVTVTGVINGGSGDMLHIFGRERNFMGKPFTVVFTFDNTKGTPTPLSGCEGSATGVEGIGANSPGTAVLTIAGKSFTFGTQKYSHSGTWREIASGCSESHLVFEADDDTARHNVMIEVNVHPPELRGSFSQNPDWRAPLSIPEVNLDSMSGFAIDHDSIYGDGGRFDIKSITIKRE